MKIKFEKEDILGYHINTIKKKLYNGFYMNIRVGFIPDSLTHPFVDNKIFSLMGLINTRLVNPYVSFFNIFHSNIASPLFWHLMEKYDVNA